MGNHRIVLLVVGVLVVALIGGGLLLRSNRDEITEDGEELSEAAEQDDPAADIVVTLEQFADYQSPACAEFDPTLKKLKQEYGNNLNLVFRNLPLPGNKNALPAAQAAEAARMQSRFWEMHDLLLKKQAEWKELEDARPVFLEFAKNIGLDIARYQRDFESQPVRLRLEADKDAALALGIQEVPAIVIEGRRLKTEAMTEDGLRQGIEVMLTRGSEESPIASP